MRRARKLIKIELEVSYVKEFGYLAAYAHVVKKSNPKSRVEVELYKEEL